MHLLQLRDLVPAQPLTSQQDGLDNKRPKHVVLSDTIALVKELQDKVCSDCIHCCHGRQAVILRLNFGCTQARLGEVNQPVLLKQEDEAQDLMRRSYPDNSASRRSAETLIFKRMNLLAWYMSSSMCYLPCRYGLTHSLSLQ